MKHRGGDRGRRRAPQPRRAVERRPRHAAVLHRPLLLDRLSLRPVRGRRMRSATQGGRFVLLAHGRALDVHTASGGDLPWEPLAALSGGTTSARSRPRPTGERPSRWTKAASARRYPAGPGVRRRSQPPPARRRGRLRAARGAPMFTKFPTCVTGPVATVQLPGGKVDWEVEVVAVVGRGGYRLDGRRRGTPSPGSPAQDLSERVLQLAGTPPNSPWASRSPASAPIGPVAVTPESCLIGTTSGSRPGCDGVAAPAGADRAR